MLSPARRELLRDGVEVRLIPRYFDLLRLLVERRDEAVHRQEIFDRVWADVIVSDGALSQAIRTLRRALGDDPHRLRLAASRARSHVAALDRAQAERGAEDEERARERDDDHRDPGLSRPAHVDPPRCGPAPTGPARLARRR